MYGEKNRSIDQLAAAGQGSLMGADMAQGMNCMAPQPSRTLANDIEDLSRAINELDDQLSMLASKLTPVLRSAGKEDCAKSPSGAFPEPAASSQVSAALIEGTRRLRFMLDRTAALRNDVAL